MVNFISQQTKLDFDDVLIVPQKGGISTRSLVDFDREFDLPYSDGILRGPGIIAANMDGVGTFEVARSLSQLGMYTALTKNLSEESLISFFREGLETDELHAADYSFYSMGIGMDDFKKFSNVDAQVGIERICIDVANGYMDAFYDHVAFIRERWPHVTIMAGNVVTPEGVEAAYKAGADIVKVGIGSGAVCTTRIVTGVGYPQFSAITETVEAAESLGVLICSDGGCKSSGDVAKAVAGGADFVMLGSMFAGTIEGGNVADDGTVNFYGMSSKTANDKHFGGLKDYRSSEGRTVKLASKGHIEPIARQILGGLASACTYSNCTSLDQLPLMAQFAHVNNTHNRWLESQTIGF
jgi:GMP reductase